MRKMTTTLAALAMLGMLSACTTTAAKKALNKPAAKDKFSGFDAEAADDSKRAADKVKPVAIDSEPEKAVVQLVADLQKDRARAASAEEQLQYWGMKQGVDKIVVSKVRPLLKNERIEVRAPALRLTIMFGKKDSHGDLIECLADTEYGIRATAFKALRSRTNLDFGFNAAGGEVARAKSVQDWRMWWQNEQRKLAVQAPSTYELNQPTEPTVVGAADKEEAAPVSDEEEKPKSKKKSKKKVEEEEEREETAASEASDEGDTGESKLLLRKK